MGDVEKRGALNEKFKAKKRRISNMCSISMNPIYHLIANSDSFRLQNYISFTSLFDSK